MKEPIFLTLGEVIGGTKNPEAPSSLINSLE